MTDELLAELRKRYDNSIPASTRVIQENVRELLDEIERLRSLDGSVSEECLREYTRENTELRKALETLASWVERYYPYARHPQVPHEKSLLESVAHLRKEKEDEPNELGQLADEIDADDRMSADPADWLREAAAEIVRLGALEAENTRLREAVKVLIPELRLLCALWHGSRVDFADAAIRELLGHPAVKAVSDESGSPDRSADHDDVSGSQ